MMCTIKFSKCSLTRHRAQIQMDAKLERHFLYRMSGPTIAWFKIFMLMDTKLLLTPFRKWYFGTTTSFIILHINSIACNTLCCCHPSISARRHFLLLLPLFIFLLIFHRSLLLIIFHLFHCFSSSSSNIHKKFIKKI